MQKNAILYCDAKNKTSDLEYEYNEYSNKE